MKPENDAFGQHLLAQYEAQQKGEPVAAEIVERDDHYVDLGALSTLYFSKYADWSETERKLIDRARGRVLDVGCGAGRHSLYLQEKGLGVTGIDNSKGALEVCRRRGLKNLYNYSIEEIDKFESASFETIIMLGHNFGLFGDGEKAKKLLAEMHRITTPDAQIITNTLDPYQTDQEAHLKYHRRNRKLGRMTGQIRLRIRYRTYVGEWFDYLFVSPAEMKEIISETDWRIEEMTDPDEARYFVTLKKKDAVN